MNVYYTGEGLVCLDVDTMVLEMTRGEAEQLFVDLGHVLQDMDIAQYNENGEETPQPEGN